MADEDGAPPYADGSREAEAGRTEASRSEPSGTEASRTEASRTEASGTEASGTEASAEGSGAGQTGGAAAPSGLAWAITTRLNRFTRKFLGPAQVGDRAAGTRVPDSLPPTPCSVCGRPLSEHELVRTTDQKMRLYCPDRSS